MKRRVIKAINYIMGVAFIIGAGSLDSQEKLIPVIMCAVPLVWAFLFMYANRDMVMNLPKRYYR